MIDHLLSVDTVGNVTQNVTVLPRKASHVENLAVEVSPWYPDMAIVSFHSPSNDGEGEIRGYRIEWWTDVGIDGNASYPLGMRQEVQTVKVSADVNGES